MIRSLLTALLTLSSIASNAQNLVPNPSFEDYNTCPDLDENISSADNWINPTSYTPDYYNVCDDAYTISWNPFDLNRGVPYNTEGTQMARTGSAYAGLITASMGLNEREYIQIQLVSPLVAGVPYKVEFYVSAGDSSQYSCNDIGAYFSSTAVSSTNTLPLPYTPQVFNDNSSNSLADTSSWIKVEGVYTAIGGEAYLTIGNFKNDMDTDTVCYQNPPQWSAYSYHFIDDVSVESVLNMGENMLVWQLNIDPSGNWIHVSGDLTRIESLKMYDLNGRLLLERFDLQSYSKVNVSEFPPGAYIISLQADGRKSSKKLFIPKL